MTGHGPTPREWAAITVLLSLGALVLGVVLGAIAWWALALAGAVDSGDVGMAAVLVALPVGLALASSISVRITR